MTINPEIIKKEEERELSNQAFLGAVLSFLLGASALWGWAGFGFVMFIAGVVLLIVSYQAHEKSK